MADSLTKAQRSHTMRQVKSRLNFSTELKAIGIFRKSGIKGWRRNFNLFGKPDFVFPKQRIAVFIDGCFWHGHDCRKLKPASNKAYWTAKIERNIHRDALVSRTLEQRRWRVIRVWECRLKDANVFNALLS